MIEPAPPARFACGAPAEPDAIALGGLLAWIAWNQVEAGCDLQVLDEGATLVVASSALAHGFQLGWREAESGPGYPFLAYGEALDWFAAAWRGVQFSAAGVLLLARTVEPLAVLLPTDWPAAVGTLARRAALANVPWCHVTPFAGAYLDRLRERPVARRAAVAHLGDLQVTRSVSIPILKEAPWFARLRMHAARA
ncbi:MAG: hypothetical protein R6X17_02050 [Candidatus Competibacteraceae bacterium]